MSEDIRYPSDLYSLLYTTYDGYHNPYRCYLWPAGGIEHEPGLKGRGQEVSASAIASAVSMGYRGINVLSYSDPVASHPVQLRWAGIDIDGKDNPTYNSPALGLANHVCRVLPQAMVRLSKSGTGVHVLLRLHPDRYPVVSYDQAKALARAIVAEPKRLLHAAGITTCVSGLPNLWLWSKDGKQKTVQVGEPVELPGSVPAVTPVAEGNIYDYTVHLGVFKGAALSAVCRWFDSPGRSSEFWKHLPAKSQVNIGEFRRRTGIEMPTKSLCRVEHAHEPNGWLELRPDGSLRLYSNADDNKCILALYSL